MSFRSVVNGECFEEASFNNTLSDSFQEPAVSNMSVAMVTAACLCSASHICVFHGPPSFYWWRSLKNILHWEQLQLWPSAVEAAPTALHSAIGLLETELQRVSLHTWCERRKSIKLKGDETSAPPRPRPMSNPQNSRLCTENLEFTWVAGLWELPLCALVLPLFWRRRVEGRGDLFLALNDHGKDHLPCISIPLNYSNWSLTL